MAEDFIAWRRHGQPPVSLDDVMGLTSRRTSLVDLDVAILEALLRYNFLTVSQASRLWELPTRTAEYRFQRLFQWQLVDRGSLPAERAGGRQQVYALAPRGFQVLERLDNPLAIDWAEDWKPKSETGSQRLSVSHELGRNDVCIAICETAKARQHPVLDWEGSREGGQRFIANASTHESYRIYPDAVLIMENMQPVFIEYERSGRDSKFQAKVRKMRAYLVSGQWQMRYPREPWVVYAIPAGLGTQGVIGGSFGGMAAKAGMTGARNYVLLDEEAWTQGTWMAMTGDGKIVNFWDAIGS